MEPKQDTIPIPLPIEGDARERAEVGERLSQLMEQPGWSDLVNGLTRYREHRVGTFPICKDGHPYADLVGELKGLANVERIAAGLVQVGEQAAAELRAAESGGS